jgi:hypothetical protein
MRYWLLLLMNLFSAVAAEKIINVDFNPQNPIKGEPFQIVFTFETSSATDAKIDFEPSGFEVLGKTNQGLSTRTIYQNGKIQVSRQMAITYEALAPRSGRVQMKNLVVTVDGETHRKDVIDLQVLEAPVEPRNVFVRAEVSKTQAYVGEGLLVRYYIYTRTNIQSFDIKKFSKLDGFMKRFLQESNDVQRVVVDGEAYRRSVIYTARVYPERAGKLVIDPMEISADYSLDPFAGLFGSGRGRDTKTRLFSSSPIEVDVKPLPPGKPDSFIGLVGRHQIDLKAEGSQLLVNEPLEVRLSVSGPGNLESLEAPLLWQVPQLEKFDSKADLSLSGLENAIKTFDYTFLAKAPGKVDAAPLELSYFDPVTQRYETVKLRLPQVIVAGTAKAPIVPRDGVTADEKPVRAVPEENNQKASPSKFTWLAEPTIWLAALATILVVILTIKGRQVYRLHQSELPKWSQDFELLKRQGPTVAVLTRLLHQLDNSDWDAESRSYWRHMLSELEKREFATSRSKEHIVVAKQHLRALHRALKKHS